MTTKPPKTSPDNDLALLKQRFPQCFDKSGDFDFDKFKKHLSRRSGLKFSTESYGMDWLGKSYARLLACDDPITLLQEDAAWNSRPENQGSENLLIRGDNLEALKHLSHAYREKIKMIYIDPPYNTGSDGFVYQDDRQFSAAELQALAGVDEEQAKRILNFTGSKSNSHSAWLTFMYPRLYVAHQLLREDGVIFISIDDNEAAQLKILMDEIFGEENFVANLIWENKEGGGSGDSKYFKIKHENLIVYGRNKDLTHIEGVEIEDQARYTLEDEHVEQRGRYQLVKLDSQSIQQSRSLIFPIESPDKEKIMPNGCWRWCAQKVAWGIEHDFVVIKQDSGGEWRVYTKQYLNVDYNNRPITRSKRQIGVIEKYSTTQSNRRIKSMFGSVVFQYSKPYELLNLLIKLSASKDDLILDFFAGSGTTADAVMQLNAEDGGCRRYILVQLDEPIDAEKSPAAYDFVKNELGAETPTIFDITKERLKRAAQKLQAEHAGKSLDLGFKVFQTVPRWEGFDIKAETFDETQQLFNERPLSEEDIQTLLTTWKTYDGIPLTQAMQRVDLAGYTGYYHGERLYLLHRGFAAKHLKNLLESMDGGKIFSPAFIIVFGYHFSSKMLREISESVFSYAGRKNTDTDFIIRYKP